jgi:hypothetical protein
MDSSDKKKSIRRTAGMKSMSSSNRKEDDSVNPIGPNQSSMTHKTPIEVSEESSSPAETEMLRGLPKPKVATAEEHRLYSAICTYNEKLFAPMTSHIVVLGAPQGASVVNSFHAGEVRTSLGKMTKKFAEAVIGLFEEGPSYKTQFASQWAHLLSESAQRNTFELQGFGPLFSYLFFHVVTAQAKFEAVDSRLTKVEQELASLKNGTIQRVESECQTDLSGDVASLADVDCTPQKPQHGSLALLGGSVSGRYEPNETLDTSAVPPEGEVMAADGTVTQHRVDHSGGYDSLSNTAAGSNFPVKPPNRKSGGGPHVREEAIERMLQRKPTNRLEPVRRQHPVSDSNLKDMRVGQPPGVGNRSPRPGLASVKSRPTSEPTAASGHGLGMEKKQRPEAMEWGVSGGEGEEEPSIFQSMSGAAGPGVKLPFSSVNGLAWKEFWNNKEKKKLQQKMGLADPPKDFSEKDASHYGHQIIKIKDDFLGTTGSLTARILRPAQPTIEDRPEARECP